MGYCFMHINRQYNFGQIKNSYDHNYRCKYVANIIPELTENNGELVSLNGRTYQEVYEERASSLGYGINKDYRKNGIMALEVLTTMPREDESKINIEKWKEDNVAWLRKAFNANPQKYGDNVLSVVYHGDETGNLHCHAFIIPVDNKGKINASFYIGDRFKMSDLQNTYAYKMKSHGLKRGIVGSVATHQEIRKFYSELKEVMNVEAPPYTPEDTLETYRQKATDYIKTLQASYLKGIKDKDREIVEAKSLPKQEYTKVLRERDALQKKFDGVEREIGTLEAMYGDMNEIKGKLKTTELLNDALKHYPDIEEANRIISDINKMISWEKKEREKEKARKKTIYEKR